MNMIDDQISISIKIDFAQQIFDLNIFRKLRLSNLGQNYEADVAYQLSLLHCDEKPGVIADCKRAPVLWNKNWTSYSTDEVNRAETKAKPLEFESLKISLEAVPLATKPFTEMVLKVDSPGAFHKNDRWFRPAAQLSFSYLEECSMDEQAFSSLRTRFLTLFESFLI